MVKILKIFSATTSLLLFLFLVPKLSAEPIAIVGTGDGTHVLRALAQDYAVINPEQVIRVPDSVGSAGGVKLVGKRKNKLGRIARKINENEEQYGLSYVPYARIPVVFYVHSSVDVSHLSVKQILDIYSGEARDWSEIGGSPGRIRVVRRERGDSSADLLNKTIKPFNNIQFGEFVKVATSERQSVRLVSVTPGAIGFGPFPDSGGPPVKVLSLEGKFPSDTGYLLNLVLGMVFYEENNTGEIKRFINYLTSEKGKEVILSSKAFPY